MALHPRDRIHRIEDAMRTRGPAGFFLNRRVRLQAERGKHEEWRGNGKVSPIAAMETIATLRFHDATRTELMGRPASYWETTTSSEHLAQRAFQGGTIVRREPETETLCRRRIDSAPLQIFAGIRAAEAIELVGVIFGDLRHDVGQRCGSFRLLLGARIGGGDIHAGLGGKLLDRVHERHAAIVGQEADRVAMRAAAEAMVEMLVVVDREARRLFVVEGAAGLPLTPGANQLDARPDDRGQRRPGAQFIEPGGGERHDSTLCANRRAASDSEKLIHRLPEHADS